MFVSERGTPFAILIRGLQAVVERGSRTARFDMKTTNDDHDTRAIQAYLGHRSIMSTVRYTALTPNRFKNFWKD